jgi:hypothetical protein
MLFTIAIVTGVLLGYAVVRPYTFSSEADALSRSFQKFGNVFRPDRSLGSRLSMRPFRAATARERFLRNTLVYL